MLKRITRGGLVVLFTMMSLALVATAARAATGAVKVDSDKVCSDPIREDNSLAPSTTAYVWLNIDPSVSTRGYTYAVYDNGVLVDSGRLHFKQCSSPYDRYRYASFTTPDEPGSYTLVVYDSTGATVSSDSFRVVI